MGLPNIFKKKSVVYRMTDIGKKKHDNALIESVPKMDIMVFLNDNGDSSPREIAEHTKIDENRVKMLLHQMAQEQWIEPRGSRDDS